MLVLLLDNLPARASMYLQENTCDVKIVLLQAGVYAANELLSQFPDSQLLAIENDWKASGLPLEPCVQLINYETWVGMCANNQPVVTIQD